MKKIIFIIALTILPFTNYAQISIFDKFEDMDDVTSVIVNKEAFKMLSKFKGSSPEAKEYAAMVENLESLKVFTTESTTIANHVSELLMFVNDMTNSANKQAVVLSLTGEIDLNKISEITEAHIPNSGKQLKNK
jgi:hypothetical protein